MGKIKDSFEIYRGLEKPIYFLMLGRVISAVGGVVLNMFSTILAVSFGYSEGKISQLLVVISLISLPCVFLGARVADKVRRKNLIILYNFLIVFLYLLASVISSDFWIIAIIFTAQIFFVLSRPVLDAIVSDFTKPEDRGKAYSLLYLGINLGYAAAPMIGAFLVVRSLDYMLYVNAFTVLINTLIIIKYIPKDPLYGDDGSENSKKIAFSKILMENKYILVYTTAALLFAFCHAQFNFGLPMQLINMFGNDLGTLRFGYIATMNCILCVVLTPIITEQSHRFGKINVFASAGIWFSVAFVIFAFAQGFYWFALGNFIYTIGEVCMASNGSAILSNIAPASHRTRVMGLNTISSEIGRMLGFSLMGGLITAYSYTIGWLILMIAPILGGILIAQLKRKYDY